MLRDILDVDGDPNPYEKDLLEFFALRQTDEEAAVRQRVALRAKIEDDIQAARLAIHSELPDQLFRYQDSQILGPVKDLIEKWIDVPARLYLFSLADRENPKNYDEVLRYLIEREEPIWQVFASALGADQVRIIVDARRSFWNLKGMRQAHRVRDEHASPSGIIVAFMEKKRIRSFDGCDGFTEKFTGFQAGKGRGHAREAIGRDTFFKVKDEKAWVRESTYAHLAEFIGCTPEQLYPRNIPRPRKRAKRTAPR